MKTSFSSKLSAAYRRSRHALTIAPRITRLPLPMQRYDDPLLPFGKAIIAATRADVCAYVFDLAAYLALGAAGAVALERTLAYVAAGDDAVSIVHAPFASAAYVAAMSDAAFNADAVTLLDEEHIPAYTTDRTRGAFVVRRGEHPVIVPLPDGAGVYWEDAALLSTMTPDGRTLSISVAGEDVLYAGRGDDFAERVRLRLRGESPPDD